MLKMNYANTEETYPVSFRLISNTVVELSGDFPVQEDGFCLSRPEHDDKWDYSGYTTVYRQIEGGVQFSCDGSVYAEPEALDFSGYGEEREKQDAEFNSVLS